MKKKVRVGIDLGGTNIKFGSLSESGEILDHGREPTDSRSGPAVLLKQLGDIAWRLLDEHSAEYRVECIGVVTPGAVDAASGTVIGGSPNIPDWVGAEIGGTLSGRLSMPVAVENDARAMALAELRVGAAQGAHSAICMTVGTGIGGGIILDGKLWRGHSQSAGEIGHAVIDIDGELGDDGLPGSLESLAAAPAIQRRVRRELEKTMTQVFEEKLAGASLDTLTARQVFEALDLADPVATRALQDTAFILGSGLTGLVNAINPERVIIGGGVSDAAPSLAPLVEAQIRRSALSSAVSDLRVLKAELGNQAGFIGAAFLSTEEPWRSQLQRDSNKKSKVER